MQGQEDCEPLDDLLRQTGWLRALAASLVRDPDAADDVVQETWMAALRHPRHAAVPVRPWLARIALNVVAPRSAGFSGVQRDWLNIRVVGRSDASGAYSARDLDPSFALTARAPGLMAERLANFPRRAGASRCVVDFDLKETGLGDRGVVLTADGSPVEGAIVAVGNLDGISLSNKDGGWDESFAFAVAETGEDGTFTVSGVRQASDGVEVEVAVMAAAYPIWTGRVAGDLGALAYLVVRLKEPASIEGVVLGANQEPAADVLLEVRSLDGNPDRSVPFPLPKTHSGLDGKYRLNGVPPGRVVLTAGSTKISDTARRSIPIDVPEGGTVRQDVLLANTTSVRGRVEDSSGKPLSGWRVEMVTELTSSLAKKAVTDPEGRFEAIECLEAPYSLWLSAPDGKGAVLNRRNVSPGDELVLVVPRLGSVRGRFLDAGERVHPPPGSEKPPSGIHIPTVSPGLFIGLESQAEVRAPQPSFHDGEFVFDSVLPGTHRVILRAVRDSADSDLIARSSWFDLAPGQTFDVGTLESEPAGSLVVEFSEALRGATISPLLLDSDFELFSFLKVRGSSWVLPALPSGQWYVDLRVRGRASNLIPVEVRPDEESVVRMNAEPGIERTLQFDLPPDATWNRLVAKVRDAEGRVRAGRVLERSERGAASLLVWLPAGRFTVEARTDSGLSGSGGFTIPRLEPQHEEIVVEVR